jgi:PEP-CTERM motif
MSSLLRSYAAARGGRRFHALALAAGISVAAVGARAAPITYIFTGTGTGALDGTSFTSFTVDLIGDTSNITSGGGENFNTSSLATVTAGGVSDTLTGGGNDVVLNSTTFPAVGFGQTQPAPIFAVVEAVANPVFTTYNLATSFPLTGGTVSSEVASYITASGTFDVQTITSLNFQAISGVPEPATWALLLMGFGGVGAALRSRRVRIAT